MSKKIFTITGINKTLFAVFILIFGYSIYDLAVNVFSGFSGAKISVQPKRPAQAEQQHAQPKPLDYYVQAISAKALFKASAADSSNAGNNLTLPQFTNTILAEQAKSLSLQGIIAGETLQAVIEDSKTAKTYFVVKNDKIGDIIIDDITVTKVKLRLGEQVMDLTL